MLDPPKKKWGFVLLNPKLLEHVANQEYIISLSTASSKFWQLVNLEHLTHDLKTMTLSFELSNSLCLYIVHSNFCTQEHVIRQVNYTGNLCIHVH